MRQTLGLLEVEDVRRPELLRPSCRSAGYRAPARLPPLREDAPVHPRAGGTTTPIAAACISPEDCSGSPGHDLAPRTRNPDALACSGSVPASSRPPPAQLTPSLAQSATICEPPRNGRCFPGPIRVALPPDPCASRAMQAPPRK